MSSVAEEIRNMANKLESLYKPTVNESPESAIEHAQDAFWAVIAQHFPQAKGGDFPPDAQQAFDAACMEAVKIWLSYNR